MFRRIDLAELIEKYIEPALRALKRFAKNIFSFLKQGVKHLISYSKKYPRVIISALSVVIVFSLLTGIMAYTGIKRAVEVKIDGKAIGTLETKNEVDEVIGLAKAQVYDEIGKKEIEKIETASVITGRRNITTAEELVEPVLKNTKGITKVATLKVDDVAIGFKDKVGEVEDLLNDYIDRSKEQNEAESVEVCDNVTACYTYASEKIVANAVSLEEELKKEDAVPLKTVVYETSKKSIPYSIQTRQTATLYVGSQVTKVYGVKGQKNVKEKVCYVDGKEISREVVRSVIVKRPVAQIVLVGTKPYKKAPNSSNIVSSYGFVWPLDRSVKNTITSYWGDGRNHKGLDIACAHGTKIYAALGGKVIQSGWFDGYGLCITIDHGNGAQTRYAHCSKLFVSVGQKVTRGENIALVGSTGQSTCSHLHFEVILNGVKVNPAPYLGI